jgi:2-hydroxyglutarate dehydrogenase
VRAPPDTDVAVLGAGIVGLAVARALLARSPGLRVRVLEREASVGLHQTGHNSGVIHSGVYYAPGSLKARLCLEGARLLYDYCDERAIGYRRCGKLIVATRPEELPLLAELERRGRANGVSGLRRLRAPELAEVEPHARGLAALHVAATGVVDFREVAASLAAELTRNGVTVQRTSRVSGIEPTRGGVELRHAGGPLIARQAVVCAGAFADELLSPAARNELRIVPFRGQYLRLAPTQRQLVRSLIYPVPEPGLPFLGVHLTRRLDGEVLVGPSAFIAGAPDAYRLTRVDPRSLMRSLTWPGTYQAARRYRRSVLTELGMVLRPRRLLDAASRIVPELDGAPVLLGPTGVRGQAVSRDGRFADDFELVVGERVLWVRNAPSPAATSAFALGEYIVSRLERRGPLAA